MVPRGARGPRSSRSCGRNAPRSWRRTAARLAWARLQATGAVRCGLGYDMMRAETPSNACRLPAARRPATSAGDATPAWGIRYAGGSAGWSRVLRRGGCAARACTLASGAAWLSPGRGAPPGAGSAGRSLVFDTIIGAFDTMPVAAFPRQYRTRANGAAANLVVTSFIVICMFIQRFTWTFFPCGDRFSGGKMGQF